MKWFRAFMHASTRSRLLIAAVLVLVGFGCALRAEPTQAATGIVHQINYQGKLLDASGAVVADGTYSMMLSLYTASSGGTPIWTAKGTTGTPTALSVTVASGLFTVSLGDTSVGGGSQNPLTGLNWNQDALYLGVTVSPDVTEMTPRKQLNAVAQAFNAEQLQGMYASSTALSGNALFIVNQTATDAASSARTALEVRSGGISNANDYLIRGVNSSSTAVFTLSRTGSVTSTELNATGTVRGLLGPGGLTARHTSTTVIGSFGASIKGLIARGKYGYVLSATRNLDIVDLTGASGVGSIGNLASPALSRIAISGNYVYGADVFNLYTIDVTNPTAPVVRATYPLTGFSGVARIVVQGSRLYLGKFDSITVFDSSDPLNLRVLGTKTVSASSSYFDVKGSLLYYSDNSGAQTVRIYDVTDPANFVQLGSIAQAAAVNVEVQGSLMFVRSQSAGASSLFDVSNPTNPVRLSTVSTDLTVSSALLRGRYLFVALDFAGSFNNINIYDISNPRSPVLIDTIASNYGFSLNAFDIAGNTLYTPGTNSLEQYAFTQAEFSGLKAYAADLSRLDVRNSATFEGAVQMLNGLAVTGGVTTDELSVYATGTRPMFEAINAAATTTDAAWGGYINSLLVGSSPTATGSRNYRMVVGYDSTQTRGVCIDNLNTPLVTCPTSNPGTNSLVAEGSITGGGFDLAEHYDLTGVAAPGELLSFDPVSSTRVMRTTGIPYDPHLMGVVSTEPGFVLGLTGDAPVALAGRVPTFVSMINGSIAVGDPITSSIYPGVAMKATKPGRILGYALEATDATSTIEVFIKVGYDASSLFANNGSDATMESDLIANAKHDVSSATPTSDSWGLTFRGRAWNGAQATNADYQLSAQVFSATSSQWSIQSGSSTLFAVDQAGNATLRGDLMLVGKLFPSARGVAQHDKYIFLDTGLASSTYMATNADGWQANDSYDFAERYYSPDVLSPGDVVVVSQNGRFHVQRSMNETLMPMGIVSTKPGFVAGAATTSTYPIALAGRVPTKVSIINGPIAIGDLLAPSNIPGVAVKATKAGPVVGQALEVFSENQVGTIEVFVHAGWWGGPTTKAPEAPKPEAPTPMVAGTKIYQGLARISASAKKVHVEFPSVGTYPLVQVTPYGEIEGGWWTQNYTHTGFDVMLKQAQMHELTFAWRVEGMTPEQSNVPLSDGTVGQLDLETGNLIPKEPVEESTTGAPATTTPPAVEDPEVQPVVVSTTTVPTLPETPPVPEQTVTTTSPEVVVVSPVVEESTSSLVVPVLDPSVQPEPISTP